MGNAKGKNFERLIRKRGNQRSENWSNRSSSDAWLEKSFSRNYKLRRRIDDE